MEKKDLRIVFMGTPDFAVGSLKRLVENGYNVVAVVTQPDKPVGRHGSVLRASAVKEYALEHGLPVLQPVKMKDEAFLEELRGYDADLQVVVAFRMLPEVVWAMPRFGTFNVHAALLPQYRGAAPINWAVINGETTTGVTTFFLDHDIDTGKIIMQREFAIPDDADVEYVYDGLMELGAGICQDTVDLVIEKDGDVPAQPQREDLPLHAAPKIFKETCEINWTLPAKLALGGVLLSSLIFVFPVLYGEGYSAINILLNGVSEADWEELLKNSLFYGHGHLLILYIALVVLTKTFATAATNGGGGCGGTFAPSLFVGAFSGFLFARLWNIYQVGVYIPEKNFTLLGMAGVMAGVMHAPLTGIFLIAEITNGYNLFMPLMIVSICSVMTISIFEPHSIYAMRLAREGKLLTHHTDRSVLTLMSMESVVEHEFTSVQPDMPLGKLVNAISKSHTSFIPVLDNAGSILGEIDITKIRHVMFRAELYNKLTVRQLMQPIAAKVGVNDSMEEVMRKFDLKGTRYLPVVNNAGHLTGYISRTRAYSMYRKMVADFSAE
jgi:methionyl-tRNA formyltransferase